MDRHADTASTHAASARAAGAHASVVATATHPTLDDPAVQIAVVTSFAVGTPDRLAALVDASTSAWQTLPWPTTLAGITWLASVDGAHALAYVQWTSDAEFEAFGRTHRPVLAARLAAAVPGLASSPPVFYRRYRSGVRPGAPTPGCVVIVSVEFDAPDEARQRAWVDLVFEALAADASPPAGGISGHFHVSTDGRRVLNYAEWVDEASHAAALASSGQGTVGAGPKWRDVRAFPGVVSSEVRRYRLVRRLAPVPSTIG
jgi:hypothetical protein